MRDSDHVSTYRGPTMPTRLGEQLAVALGLDDRPETFGDWVRELRRIAERDAVPLDVDALCTTDDSPHRASFDGQTAHYRCVQDPIVLPFLADNVDAVRIETHSPVSEHPIELTVTETGIDADPADAVFSFGVDATVEEPPDDVASPILAYGRFCPYGHAFPSRAEYETWADSVDAITMPVSMTDTFELARALGRSAR